MAHRVHAAVALALAAIVALPVGASAASPSPVPSAASVGTDGTTSWAEGRILVGYAKGTTKADKQLAHAAAKASRAKALPGAPGVEVVQTTLPVKDAIAKLKGAKGVRYAEPDYLVHVDFVPNDTFYGSEWGLHQASGIDIGAPAAWDITTGSPSTLVAVIDTGVQLNHPDLVANIWTNPGEVAGNGIDDDDDGYVDDVHGWDFVDDDNQPNDENGHGTHVAGTVAATGNNGLGVTGVAFGSKVLPLRMLDENGTGFLSDGVRALAYARAHGARVANLSWSFAGAISQPLWDVIESVGDDGLLVVAAAGNDGFDADKTPKYPAAYDLPSIISVAALKQTGAIAAFSNRGPSSVDIAAPGEDILSTWINGTYAYLDGTSMASPHVAGVAALLVSLHPTWTVAQLRDRILGTARPLSGLIGLVGTAGLVDAPAALGVAPDTAPTVQITAPTAGTRVLPGTALHLTATATDPDDGDVSASIIWRSNVMGNLGTGASLTRADLTVGTHLIVATARDAAGHRRSTTVRIQVTPPVSFVDEHAEPRPPTIAVAPDGTPVLTWAENGTGTIASRADGAAWTRELVSSSYADRSSDVLVDPAGVVHMAIQRTWKEIRSGSDGGIVVASDDGTGNGTGWTLDRVSEGCGDDAQGCGIDTNPSIARDPSGRLELAWSRIPIPGSSIAGNRPGLWHAVSNSAGGWNTERVLAADDVLLPDLATAADGSAHIVFWRTGGDADGLYHASDETGDWVIDLVADLPADGNVDAPSVQLGAAGRVDVAWATTDGVTVRSRTGGTWQAPVEVTGQAAEDVSLVRDGTTLHLVFGMIDGTQTASGVGYAVDTGAGWSVETLDSGQDVHPRLAVGPGGEPHVAYLRSFPGHEVRHATLDGTWSTDVVDEGYTWEDPAVGVDAAGHHHVAVARYGSEPGVWYATDTTGDWTLERLTQEPPDGPVGLVVAPNGSVAIAYAEFFDENGDLLADRAVWLKTGTTGAWTTTRIATSTGAPAPALARGPTGRLYVAYSQLVAGRARIAVATDATGTWATGFATPGAATTADLSPSIAVDPHGKVHLAYEERTPATSGVVIRYATNATGSWVRTLIASGTDPRIAPRIALTTAGVPRVAYWIRKLSTGRSLGIRLAAKAGTTWTTKAVSNDQYDTAPALAVDPQGYPHLLWTRSVGYAICQVPFCSLAPGMRHWSDAPGFGAARRVTDYADDTYAALARGADGTIRGVFAAPGWRLGVVDLWAPTPSLAGLGVHLAPSGTVAAGRSLIQVAWTPRSAVAFRLQQQQNGGAWGTLGSLAGTTTRNVSVPLSTTITRRYRVTAYDGLGRAGTTATGPTLRAVGQSEAPGAGVVYTGTWGTARNAAFWGGAARTATSTSASVTWTVTARELAFTALRGTGQGDARVYIDGKLAATIQLGTGGTAYRQLVYRKVFGATAKHRITIKPAGNGHVTVDGFLAIR